MTWTAALLALVELAPHVTLQPAWHVWAAQFGGIALIAAAERLWKESFLETGTAAPVEESTATPTATPTATAQPQSTRNILGSLWSLMASLAMACGFMIVGEAVVTQLTPWKTYPSAEPLGAPYAELLGDGNELTLTPRSIARVRYTPTRRDIEIERGAVMVRLNRCSSPGELNTQPRAVVRAGSATLTLAQAGSKCRLSDTNSAAEKTKAAALPFGLPEGDRDRIYATNEVLIQRDGAETSLLVKEGADLRLKGPSRSWWARWLPAGRALMRGELLVVQDEHWRSETPGPEDRFDRLAWLSGELSFHSVPLAVAVRQINQFATRRLEIQDDSIAAIPVTGSFRYFQHADLAERFVVALERDGKARQAPQGITDPDIALVAFDADPEKYGPVAQQVTSDLCASYRGEHDPTSYVHDPTNPNPEITIQVAGCDVATALAGFSQQSGFPYQLVTAPARATLAHPINGRYFVKDALAILLGGTGCRASGDTVSGLKVACSRG
jgi:ferric-dicitrate binding protein FerR (iron transport regulator)